MGRSPRAAAEVPDVLAVTPGVVSPAEAIAASLCWLNRFKSQLPAGNGPRRIASKVEGYWHDKACRYCPVPAAELMVRINTAMHDLHDEQGRPTATLDAFERLRSPAKTAKVREAQEGAWFDELTRSG